ncbi:unnamed protein product [Wuchereria bancrofti]|uniref:Uncharacterized protein n=1 Tax=Wuchereria bancrofti TaxID=6293 RepID=A0A3P7E617_WUCBA|nr:unnamed protein product [Wuchereria bancrofti]
MKKRFFMDLTRILDLNRPEKPTALLNRLRKFLPEIATANSSLNSATKCDIKIIAVEDENDTSSSTESDEEPEIKTKQPQIVMDITTVVEDSRTVISDSDSELGGDGGQQTLPVGFQIKEPMRKRKRKHLIEEVADKYIIGENINSDQEISVGSKELNTELQSL